MENTLITTDQKKDLEQLLNKVKEHYSLGDENWFCNVINKPDPRLSYENRVKMCTDLLKSDKEYVNMAEQEKKEWRKNFDTNRDSSMSSYEDSNTQELKNTKDTENTTNPVNNNRSYYERLNTALGYPDFPEPKVNKMSTASLVLGGLSVFLWEFSIFQILAIIFGVIGLIRTKKEGGVSSAIIGIILGVVYLVVRIAN